MPRKKKQTYCSDCSSVLEKDEVALSKKMFGRNITAFYCLNCIAGILDCELTDLKVKIQEFREQGCALFL